MDIPESVDLVASLEEECIWRQARGSVAELSGSEEVATTTEKVGIHCIQLYTISFHILELFPNALLNQCDVVIRWVLHRSGLTSWITLPFQTQAMNQDLKWKSNL